MSHGEHGSGEDSLKVVIAALRTGHPRHFSLQDSFSAMTDAVLGNTYDLPASAFAGDIAFSRYATRAGMTTHTVSGEHEGMPRICVFTGLPSTVATHRGSYVAFGAAPERSIVHWLSIVHATNDQ